jgi:6-phosphogluconate dehydrogenase
MSTSEPSPVLAAPGTIDFGVVGLGVMGAQLARNVASRGFSVAGLERDPAAARRVAAAYPEAKLQVAESAAEFVALLAPPRRILVMVPAGKPVDDVLDLLDPLLGADDILIDGGNSHFADTERRQARAAGRPWRFVGMGVSGGEEGALRGPSLMPGGDREAYARLRPVLEAIAARSASGACVTHCGNGAAGHFVKMVHNGIEYGDMQLIAETVTLAMGGLGLDHDGTADLFAAWNQGELESFLVELTAQVLRVADPERPGARLVDAILDVAGQKGTGKWTVAAALDLGVAIPTITAAVDARIGSSDKALRVRAEAALRGPGGFVRAPLAGLGPDDLAHALYAAKLASYTQGFSMLRAASQARGYDVPLAEVARIWTAGCIIRARFLGRIQEALSGAAAEVPLALTPGFVDDVRARMPALRRVLAAAVAGGYAVPGLAASLTWFDTLATGRGSAWVIQAQRDAFGAHGFERVERPGVAVRAKWG